MVCHSIRLLNYRHSASNIKSTLCIKKECKKPVNLTVIGPGQCNFDFLEHNHVFK